MTFPVIPQRSSTLMLAVRSQLGTQTGPSIGYKLLMLQRSSTSNFMPNVYVFPGGTTEATDFISEWWELIGANSLPKKMAMSSSLFYKSFTDLPGNSLPAHIGFRITAIRETFEESGVLLVKPLNGDMPSLSDIHNMSKEIQSWRKKVHQDASSFIQLCRTIKCAPDVWSLCEWSNWITPAQSLRRFNTMFYFAFLDNEPEMIHDGKEVTHSLWISPDEALLRCLKNKLCLGPPQFYELSRISRFNNIDNLKRFVESLQGVEEWEAVRARTKNGDEIIFFPADAMYETIKTETYNYVKNYVKTMPPGVKRLPMMTLDKTTGEIHHKKQDMNHLIQPAGQRQFTLHCNTKQKYNMPLPVEKYFFNKFTKRNSKL